MAETTDRYALPLLQSGQAQKEVTHNGALAGIDTLLRLGVESQTLNAPPAAPAVGSAWIVAGQPTGIWVGHAGHIAAFDAGGWSYVVPRIGCLAFVKDLGVFAVFIAGAWRSDAWPVRGIGVGGRTLFAAPPATIAPTAGGSVIDVEARATLTALVATLRAAEVVASG